MAFGIVPGIRPRIRQHKGKNGSVFMGVCPNMTFVTSHDQPANGQPKTTAGTILRPCIRCILLENMMQTVCGNSRTGVFDVDPVGIGYSNIVQSPLSWGASSHQEAAFPEIWISPYLDSTIAMRKLTCII